jgi:hypothetical protein
MFRVQLKDSTSGISFHLGLASIIYAITQPQELRPTPYEAWRMLASLLFVCDELEQMSTQARKQWLATARQDVFWTPRDPVSCAVRMHTSCVVCFSPWCRRVHHTRRYGWHGYLNSWEQFLSLLLCADSVFRTMCWRSSGHCTLWSRSLWRTGACFTAAWKRSWASVGAPTPDIVVLPVLFVVKMCDSCICVVHGNVSVSSNGACSRQFLNTPVAHRPLGVARGPLLGGALDLQ